MVILSRHENNSSFVVAYTFEILLKMLYKSTLKFLIEGTLEEVPLIAHLLKVFEAMPDLSILILMQNVILYIMKY